MDQIRALFIHHSTGGLLLRQGNVRELLRNIAPHISLWDHGYNGYPSSVLSQVLGPLTFRTGLSDSQGVVTGTDYNIVISNNSPKSYADLFSRNITDHTLSRILSYDLVIFKNCFPTSHIISDSQLSDYKLFYTIIFKSVSRFRNKFIAFTPPPLRRECTNSLAARRAHDLAVWMKSLENKLAVNISVFDFFHLLADSEGENAHMLKRSYCSIIPFDSHPNRKANREIASQFVEAIVRRVS